MAKVENLKPSNNAAGDGSGLPAVRRGWPGGADGPDAITSRADPRFAAVVAAERSQGLPLGARRGWPGRRG